MKELGAILKQERKKRKLTQCQVAAMVGIGQSNLSKIEKGLDNAAFKGVFKLLKLYRIKDAEVMRLI